MLIIGTQLATNFVNFSAIVILPLRSLDRYIGTTFEAISCAHRLWFSSW